MTPETRTMKNSSRLLAEIAKNLTRSRSGWASFDASSRTRRLKASHDNSRLTKRAGSSRRVDESAGDARKESFSGGLAAIVIATRSTLSDAPQKAARTQHSVCA